MAQLSKDRLKELVSSPVEGLNVEVKRWFDISTPEGQAKIVRACLALRNRNGGYLVIGFDNTSGKPVSDDRPSDVRATYHVDSIQALVSRFASEPFEVEVDYGELDRQDFPVIAVPAGVRSPVAAKVGLKTSDGKAALLRRGDVLFRTLAANGTASTSVARPEDWRDLVEICFDNREADFGRFLRRQIGAADIRTLIGALSSLGGPPASPSLRDLTIAGLEAGESRRAAAIARRNLSQDDMAFLNVGSWSVNLKFDPPRSRGAPDQSFLSTLAASNPQYTGWPMWLDSRGFRIAEDRPYVLDGAWEALIVSPGYAAHADFMRISPSGEFYLWRLFQDDISESNVKPGTVLDPSLMILRIAEVIAVGLAFGKALNFDAAKSTLGFAFRWKGLAGRKLVRWADSYSETVGYDPAHQDQVDSYVEVPMDTAPQAIAPSVDAATRDLFAAFGGHQVPLNHIEDRVARLLSRQW